jgi:hypothetical protein
MPQIKPEAHEGVKCPGLACDSQRICLRVQRPEVPKQRWTAFYDLLGLGDSRCEFFLPIPSSTGDVLPPGA